MTDDDRKLLELATKAMGRKIIGWNARNNEYVAILDDGSYWQPLLENRITDRMGDALRLAVAIQLGISIPPVSDGRVDVVTFYGPIISIVEYPTNGDRYIATRRAIVRAAAATMKEN